MAAACDAPWTSARGRRAARALALADVPARGRRRARPVPADGIARARWLGARLGPGDPRRRVTGSCCASSWTRTGCSPRTPCATWTTASSGAPAGAVALDHGRPVAVVLEYTGLSPQPLFVMGDRAGVVGALRDVIRPRTAFLAARPELLSAAATVYRVSDGPPMVRMWVDRASFRPAPAARDPAGARGHRRPQQAVRLRADLVAAVGVGRQRRLLRHPHQRPAGGCRRDPRGQP